MAPAGGLILPDASYYDTSGDFDEATTATNKRNMELLNTYIKTITQLAGPRPAQAPALDPSSVPDRKLR